MATGTKARKTYLELLRIFCAGLVIFNHIPGYTLYQSIEGNGRFLCLFLTMLTRINVPIFFMISGSLLLGKEEDYKTVINKRASRVMLLIVMAEVSYYCCNWYKQNYMVDKPISFSLSELFRGIFSGDAGPTAYWYFYAYLGFLLLLPLLRRIAQGLKREDIIVLIGLHFLFSSFLPLLNFGLTNSSLEKFTLHSKFEVLLATKSALFYPLIGYYFDHKVDIHTLSARTLRLIFILALTGIVISSACTDYQGITQGKYRTPTLRGQSQSNYLLSRLSHPGNLYVRPYITQPVFKVFVFLEARPFSPWHLLSLDCQKHGHKRAADIFAPAYSRHEEDTLTVPNRRT